MNRQNFAVTAHETWNIEAELNDAIGDDLNLEGATVSFRLDYGEGVLEAPMTVANDAQGVVRAVVTPAQNTSVLDGVYPYEIRAVLPGGAVTSQLAGYVTVNPTLFAE